MNFIKIVIIIYEKNQKFLYKPFQNTFISFISSFNFSDQQSFTILLENSQYLDYFHSAFCDF